MDGSSIWFYPMLFVTGLAAGFVDSIAGGGGLITLPVLMSTGMAPQDALGTNKLQATFGSGSAAWHFTRANLVNPRQCLSGILYTAIGATAGTLLVRQIDPKVLSLVIPWMLIGLAVYFLLKPSLGAKPQRARLTPNSFHMLFGLLIGFYDGIFGPGTGTFWAMAYMIFLGLALTQATAHTKVMNLTSNVVSLAVFGMAGNVLLLPGTVMGLGQLIGARIGSGTVIKQGAKIIRPVFLIVVLAIAVKLLLFRS